MIKKITLLAKENNHPVVGIPSTIKSDLGSASVYVYLENPDLKDVSISISRVEICAQDGQVQDFTFVAQVVQLKPSENSQVLLKSTNQVGYSKKSQVKAILTYQIEEDSYSIESEAVNVA